MSLPESTKQRALRIDLDHHKRPEPLVRAKWLLAIAAAIASVAYAGYLYVPGSQGETQFAPGPVAAAHSAWNHKCSECHANFHAIRGDAWGMNAASAAVTDEKCQVCHTAPAHHTNLSPQSPHSVESCGGCHQDHQGVAASLVRMDDNHCTRCHSDLAKVVSERTLSAPEMPAITGFATAHPAFRSLAADPSHIKFNHSLHMTAGMPKEASAGAGGALSKYEEIADKDYLAHAIGGWTDKQVGNIQLTCASCHEAEPAAQSAFGGANQQGKRLTANMAPIQFDRHCQACHELKVGPQQNDVVPHGLKKAELEQAVYAFLANDNEKPTAESERARALRLLDKPDDDLVAGKLLNKDTTRLDAVRTHLATATCVKCHEFPAGETPFSSDVVLPAVPQTWFRHARFDHTAHRFANCLQCHPQARGPADEKQTSLQALFAEHPPSVVSRDVMIRGYESCTECHSANPKSAGPQQVAGARSDCAECHTYHGGELAPHAAKQAPLAPKRSGP